MVPARRRMSEAHRSGTALTPSKREQVLMCRDPRHKTAGPIAYETAAITPAAPGPLIAKTPTISSLMAGVATCRSQAPKCSETSRPRRRTGNAIAPRRSGMLPRRTAPVRAAPEVRDQSPAIGALGSAAPGGRCRAGHGPCDAWCRADPRRGPGGAGSSTSEFQWSRENVVELRRSTHCISLMCANERMNWHSSDVACDVVRRSTSNP